MRRSIQFARRALLHLVNRGRLRCVAARLKAEGRVPAFVIASPPDMHLAPLAVLHGNPRIAHVIVGNGLTCGDIEWLQAQAPTTPVVQLKASLKGNASTYLPHAEVVRVCQGAAPSDFCIQDADCFVTDSEWWNQLRFTSARQYAAGPFEKQVDRLGALMPDTYLVLINGAAYREREAQGVRPHIATVPVPAVRRLLNARGIPGDYFPEKGKNYYDTLYMHWTAATLNGDEFLHLPGGNQTVVHVGGSSYLNGKLCTDVTHWDYWPLNTPYFHMRVLEFPRFAPIRPRFAPVFERFGSPDRLLKDHTEFRKSNRFRTSEKILTQFRPFLMSENQ